MAITETAIAMLNAYELVGPCTPPIAGERASQLLGWRLLRHEIRGLVEQLAHAGLLSRSLSPGQSTIYTITSAGRAALSGLDGDDDETRSR
jgi:hypothetical protein